MNTFNPYPKYREIKLKWLDRIPSHWFLGRVKNVIFEIDRRTETGVEPLLSLTRSSGLIRYSKVNGKLPKPKDLIGYKLCMKNEIIMNRMQAWTGMFDDAKEMGLVSPDYSILKTRSSFSAKYLVYAFRSQKFVEQFALRSKGIGSGFNRLYWNQLGQIEIFCPMLDEQEAIVRFLNAKTSQINRLIQQKKKLVSLLKEQKQVIINQAVTQGINPSVGFKPTGVKWLGEIPEHWKIQRLRILADVMASNVDKNIVDGELSVCLCNYVDVYKNELITAELNFMKGSASPDEIRKFEVKAGDVIITKDSESWQDIAVPAYVPLDLPNVVCGYHLSILRPHFNQISGEYLFRLIQSDPVANQLRIAANGVTRFGLSQRAIKDTILPVPPLGEQIKIVDFVRKASSQIDLAIVAAEKEIRLIQEYRDRLISDVVTGTLDVREVKIVESLLEESVAYQTEAEETEESLELVGVADEDD